ncbi:MAG: hypothetical protein ABIS59_04380 [Candidatus Saccharibacteria bacterium]
MTTTDMVRPVTGVTDVGYLKFLIAELQGQATSVLSAAKAARSEDSPHEELPSIRDDSLEDKLISIGRAFRFVWSDTPVHPEFAQLVKRSYENSGRSLCCITLSKGLAALDSQIDQLLCTPVFSN